MVTLRLLWLNLRLRLSELLAPSRPDLLARYRAVWQADVIARRGKSL